MQHNQGNKVDHIEREEKEFLPTVVVVGAGPSALWNIAQLKLHCPKVKILMLEKYPQYQRQHILRVEKSSYSNAHPDKKFQQLLSEMTGKVLTTDIENKLLNFVKDLGVRIQYERVENCELLAKKYPSAQLFIGGDGAHSTVHKQVFDNELEIHNTLKYIAQIKYHVTGNTRALGLLESAGVLSRVNHTAYEQVGREKDSKTPIAISFIIDEDTFQSINSARGKSFYTLADKNKIPNDLMQSIDTFITARNEITNENRIINSEKITVTDLSVSYSKDFVKDKYGKKWCLIGDAAIRMPFFKSFNIGLVGGTRFALLASDYLDPKPLVKQQPSFFSSYTSSQQAIQDPLETYNAYMKALAATEANKATFKAKGIGSLEYSAATMQAVPTSQSFLPNDLNNELDDRYGVRRSSFSTTSFGKKTPHDKLEMKEDSEILAPSRCRIS